MGRRGRFVAGGAPAALVALCALWCGGGCTLGKGEGWVAGSLWVDSCSDGESLGDSSAAPEPFDLLADFFAGEPKRDNAPVAAQRRNTLTIRVQHTSNKVEVADGMMLQLNDLDLAARSFAAGRAMSFSESSLCEDKGYSWCPNTDPLRAMLYLYASCVDMRQPLVAAGYALAPSPTDSACLQPGRDAGGDVAAPRGCPPLDAAARQSLQSLCAGADFGDETLRPRVEQLLGAGPCLFLCTLGGARAGQNPAELEGFSLEYGDEVAAIFSIPIVDGRAVRLDRCARAVGRVSGMFRFELTRGRAAQSFP